MFREMRRKGQQLPLEECLAILEKGTSGVLAVMGEEGYPYAVPLSYVYDGSTLFFHCAQEGHKLDGIRHSDKVSFCVVQQDEVVPERYTTRYRSVIVFGRARILEQKTEKREAGFKLAAKYHPSAGPEERRQAVEKDLGALCVIALTMEHITGKESLELARARQER